jgi:HNH endonuclease
VASQIAIPQEAMDRWWAKVEFRPGPMESECWIWTAAVTQDEGYPRFKLYGKTRYAHRMSYVTFAGPIPEGLTIDHLCRVRRCVNPEHLDPVTIRINTLRGDGPSALNRRKTHCKYGHEFTPDNTRVDTKGRRTCLVCHRKYHREWMRTRHGYKARRVV